MLWCAAAGPRRGFGHLMRCGVLAEVLGARRELVLRGARSTIHAAIRLGWTIHRGGPRRVMSSLSPDLVVVDDPSPREVARYVRHARGLGIPVATIHDLGLGRAASDLVIDGSVTRPRRTPPADLEGPAFAVLTPAIAALRLRPPVRSRQRVLIALGGGANARAIGVRLARRMSREIPEASIQVVAGFAGAALKQPLPPRCTWLDAPVGLAQALATATVAVVAGGVTLYEAAALGTPTVAIAIVGAQRAAVRAVASAGAAMNATAPAGPRAFDRAIADVRRLLDDPAHAHALGRRAQKLVDGHGAARVARSLQMLAGQRVDEVRHAA